MEDYRIKIECGDTNLGSRENLLKILSKFHVRVTKLVNKKDYFLVFVNDSSDTEKVFRNEVTAALHHCSFKAFLPRELKANRSVILRSVDKQLMAHSEERIKEEILLCNPWCIADDEHNLIDVLKIGLTIVKLIFNSSVVAEIPCKQGLSMFNMHIPAYNISKDKFIRLNTCYVCYKPEDHMTNECPQKASNPNFRICSTCSSQDHTYQNCNIDRRHSKCINCGENHETLSMTCSIRKNALKTKKSNTQNMKFSDAVKSSTSIPTISNDQMQKAFSLTVLALLKNIENPGTFAQELNALHQMNGLPALNLSRYVPPQLSTIQSCFGSTVQAGTHSNTLPASVNSSVPRPEVHSDVMRAGGGSGGDAMRPDDVTRGSNVLFASDVMRPGDVMRDSEVMHGSDVMRTTSPRTSTTIESLWLNSPTTFVSPRRDVPTTTPSPHHETHTTYAPPRLDAWQDSAAAVPVPSYDVPSSPLPTPATVPCTSPLLLPASQQRVEPLMNDTPVLDSEAIAEHESSTSAVPTAATAAVTAPSSKPVGMGQAVPQTSNTKNKAKVPDWRNFKLYKTWGAKITTAEELSTELDRGNAMIVRNDGNLLGRTTISALINSKPLPPAITLKKDQFSELIKSPRRFVRK